MEENNSMNEIENLRRKLKELTDIRERFDQLEERYNQETRLFSLITWHMLDAVARVSADGTIVYLSPSHEQIFGFKPEERIGKSAYSFIHPADAKVVRNVLREYINSREPGSVEFRYLLGNGKYCWVESVVSIIVGDQDDVEDIIVSTRSIEERKKTEIALRESERLYRNVIENIRDVFFRMDHNGIIEMISPSGAKLLGYDSVADLIGKNLFVDFFAGPKERDKFLQAIGEYGYLDDYEMTLRTRDGLMVQAATSSHYDYDSVTGSLVIEGIVRDISARKRAEEEIRKSEEKFRKMTEASNVGISIVDGEKFLYVNPMTRKMSGYSEEEYLSRPLWDFVTPEAREIIMQRARDRLAGKPVPDRYEISVLARDGSTRVAEVGAAVIEYNGKPATIFTLYDVTDRKIAEAQREMLQTQLNRAQKIDSIGTLAAGIAHDFNNVLSGIQGHCSLLQLHLSSDDPHLKHMQGIENQVRSGAHLTRQLLEMVSGGTYEMKPTNMNAVLTQISDMFSRAKRGIAVTRRLDEDLWSVEADAGQMDQVFLNLFINAAHAMKDEGDLYLESRNVAVREEDERPFGMKPGRYVKLSVTDNGTGMDSQTVEKAFQPFFTTKTKGMGTGLGLTSAYSIVKNHRGYIMIDSKLGVGTTIHIYLPAITQMAQGQTRQSRELLKGNETILLVDDEAIIADTTKEILEMLGYRMMLAGSGQEAVAVFMEKGPQIDLVILDMVMPGMGGVKVFEALRTMNPGIGIILYSGYSVNSEIQSLLDQGNCRFIQKPFGIEDLSQKIREVIEPKNKNQG